MNSPSVRAIFDRIARTLRDPSPGGARERKAGLRALRSRRFRAPYLLRRYHDLLCFLSAYPDDRSMLRVVEDELAGMGGRLADASEDTAEALLDSGIDGSPVCFEFTYEAAVKLAAGFPGELDIDWDAYEEPAKLDELLIHMIAHAELQTFDEGDISTQDWVRLARGAFRGTDFDWLIRQAERTALVPDARKQLYDAAEVPLRWDLSGSRGSVTRCRIESGRIVYRGEAAPPTRRAAAAEIVRPLPKLRPVDPGPGRALIHTAVAAIGARHREVYAFNYGNPEEVYLADVGRGVKVLVIGVEPARRFNLEGNYGFVAFKNGVPTGYGGASALFLQANTGVNVFEPFRPGGEAQFIYTQVLRTFHALFKNTRFVANPFQFGGDNPEAIASGAFWFYHKLGFRPADPEIRRLADGELAKRKRKKNYRSDRPTLRRLASNDLHLPLPGARRGQVFAESWLQAVALGVTERLGTIAAGNRLRAADRLSAETARILGVGDRRRWPRAEQEGFKRLAPVVALLEDVARWSATEKRRLVELMRAKGGGLERDYVHALRAHDRFRRALAAWCRGRRRE